jgi:glutathione S-transferase
MRAVSAGDAAPLAYDFVPIVQHGDFTASTTAAAMQYAGEMLGLCPDDAISRAKANQIVVGEEAMRNAVFYGAYMRNEAKRGLYAHWLGHFERFLRTASKTNATKGPYVLGAELCYADVSLYDCLTAIWALECYPNEDGTGGDNEGGRRKEFPLLSALVDAVGAQPKLKDYVEVHR